MPPKSIWRGPQAQHFTLVHRSQQDPLLYDADASKRVLKPVTRQNERHAEERGDASACSSRASDAARMPKSRQQLERDLGTVASKERENVGEAAEYGIYFDDTEYDYMQHLRSIGGNDNSRRGGKDEEVDAEVIMLEAPQTKQQAKAKALAHESDRHGRQHAMVDDDVDLGGIRLKERPQQASNLNLPAEVLPSQHVVPRTYAEDKVTGLRPDLDPHLRQVLEALDDEAFLMRTAGTHGKVTGSAEAGNGDSGLTTVPQVQDANFGSEDEEDIDDFFDNIVQGGELDQGEAQPDWQNLPPEGEESIHLDPSARAARELLELREQGKGAEDLSLTSRVALFKKAAAEQSAKPSKDDSNLEHGLQSLGIPAPNNQVRAPSSTGSKSIFGEKGPTRKSRHAGSKARLAGSFYAPSSAGGSTAFSMSSSAMERNQGLTGLDEQFARMEKIYEDEDESEEDEADEDPVEKLQSDPRNIEGIFDEFLGKNEVVGKRLRQRLGDADATPTEKVDMIRDELGSLRAIDRQTWDEAQAAGMGPEESVEEIISRDLRSREEARRDFDVETIQTTRTNLAHRPRTITAAQSVAPSRVSRIVPEKANGDGTESTQDRMPRVKIDPRTGAVRTHGYIKIRGDGVKGSQSRGPGVNADSDSEIDEPASHLYIGPNVEPSDAAKDEVDDGVESDTTEQGSKTVRRDRNESAEEKRARKAAVKADKQNRRLEKSERKSQFQKASVQGRAKHSFAIAGQSLA